MNIWFTDLDNTLIYSHRHNIPQPKHVAEYYQGREQSYITEFTLSVLQDYTNNPDNLLIPLTTRTQIQYERLSPLMEKLHFRYSLIENGAVLLDNGNYDPLWKKESSDLTSNYTIYLKEIYYILNETIEEKHLHDNSPFMVYAKTEENHLIINELRSMYSDKGIKILYSGGKLYCLPSVLSKGNAVRRFVKRFLTENSKLTQNCRLIASGDSEFDISMLSECDISFYPESLSDNTSFGKSGIPVKGFFSDGFCRIYSGNYR